MTTAAAAPGAGPFLPNTPPPVSADPNSAPQQKDFASHLDDAQQQPVPTRPVRLVNVDLQSIFQVAPADSGKDKPQSEEAPKDPSVSADAAAILPMPVPPMLVPQPPLPPIALHFSLEKGSHKGEGEDTDASSKDAGKAQLPGIPLAVPQILPVERFSAALRPSESTAAAPRPAVEGAAPKTGESSQDRAADSRTGKTLVSDSPTPSPAPAPQEMAVAFRLKQPGQEPASNGAPRHPAPVKEPRRVGLDDIAPPSAPRAQSFPGAAFSRPESSPAASSPDPTAKIEAPAQPLEVAPLHKEMPAKPIEPVRDLSIQVGPSNQERVELRVMQQAGELRVAVRATDPDLAHGLRQGIPEVLTRLQEGGFRAEGWRPAGVVSGVSAAPEISRSSADFPNADSQPQQGWSQQDRGERHHHHGHRPQWVEELEGNLAGDGSNSTGAFYGVTY